MSFYHDAARCIYFGLPPCYASEEQNLLLPCEDALWKTKMPLEWINVLSQPSPYGHSVETRMQGIDMLPILRRMKNPNTSATNIGAPSILLNPYSLFLLIHMLLRDLFVLLSSTKLSEWIFQQELLSIQHGLSNWLRYWLESPETPNINSQEEPVFVCDALPYYWLGQVRCIDILM